MILCRVRVSAREVSTAGRQGQSRDWVGFLLCHFPGASGNGQGKAPFGDQALNLEKGALQSGQVYNQWWRQIDLEN